MTWDMIIFVVMCALFIAGTVCTLLCCVAMVQTILNNDVGDDEL